MGKLFNRLKAWFFHQGNPDKSTAMRVIQPDADAQDDNHLVQDVVPYDENLLERSRTQWQFGDWESLASLSRDTLQHHPDRAKLALLAAAGHAQQGDAEQARHYIRLAQDWGCSKKLISQVLISGVHNSLGRAAAASGQAQKTALHFESAIRVGMPNLDSRLLTQARAQQQLSDMGLVDPSPLFALGENAKLPPRERP